MIQYSLVYFQSSDLSDPLVALHSEETFQAGDTTLIYQSILDQFDHGVRITQASSDVSSACSDVSVTSSDDTVVRDTVGDIGMAESGSDESMCQPQDAGASARSQLSSDGR